MELELEEEPWAIRLRRQAGEEAGGQADTLRSVCKAAINNILEVHPAILHVLTWGTWKDLHALDGAVVICV